MEYDPIVVGICTVPVRLPVCGADMDLHVAAVHGVPDPEESVEKIGAGVSVRDSRPVDGDRPSVGGEEGVRVEAASMPEGAEPRFRDGTLLHCYRRLK